MSGADDDADGEGDDADVLQLVPDTQVQHVVRGYPAANERQGYYCMLD